MDKQLSQAASHDADDEKNMLDKKCLTEKEAAEYISMSCAFLRKSRCEGVRHNRTPGPAYLKIGTNIRYLRSDLDAWLLQHRVECIPYQTDSLFD